MLVSTSDATDDVAEAADDLAATVLGLKKERDTWRAVAESYQKAFEDQTARLAEVQDICFATQMELENERIANRHSQKSSEVSQASPHGTIDGTDGTDDKLDNSSSGTATIYESRHAEVTLRPNFCFRRVEYFTARRDYDTALREVDHLLRGPLTPQARIEGLLLKSTIMRRLEWLYDALAVCSEGLELCNRLEELHAYLPRIQYQRGFCYYQLQMLKQAREAFNEVCADDDVLYAKASEMREFCDDQLHGRRPGFEAHRTVTEGLLAQISDDDSQSPRTAILLSPPRGKTSTVRKIAEKYERPQLQIPGTEPAKPKHNLKEEYKDPWQQKNEEQLQSERVRKGSGGLNPHLKEPWERARDEAFSALRNDRDSGPGAEGTPLTGGTQAQLHTLDTLRAELPNAASIHLQSGTRSTFLPEGVTPFAYALDPWLQQNPEYRHLLEPTTPSSTQASPVHGSSVHAEGSTRTAEAFPEFPFQSIAAYLRDRNIVEIRAKILHVKTLLFRCGVLVMTARSLEQAEFLHSARVSPDSEGEEEDPGKGWYKAYYEAGRAAEKAGAMAAELSKKELWLDGLQARTWYWKGRADAGMKRWDEAGKAFGKVGKYDATKNGLTALERRDVELRREEWEMKVELAQQGRQGDEVLDDLTGGLEDKAVDSEPVRAEGDEKSDDVKREQREQLGTIINDMKAKYKMKYIRPFSLEEQEYIINGVPVPVRKQTKDFEERGVSRR
ncbi:uncharacterized protein N0V89_007725 [Didymosphaeria variabile]|uniref:TPR-like protein n=1 Tax=Didymosphaeria variabile TaxID=1932322 RepID=A0A9W9CAQ9_9PLEO|nr:uncharacterized protein N0V89_007725 [Didymosphaeria variabile]KAJ4352377.1 hypothetical protein N0V89_007725 [Didymosphaeria variabile]